MCETDYSGYPDCRDSTIKAMQVALSLGLDRPLVLHTPLMWIDKAETFALAEAIGGQPLLELIIEDSHSCYLGDRTQRHDWGYGCGECPACKLRSQGFETFIARRGQ
jgi:7-cyano-7-deazaguanine synthase